MRYVAGLLLLLSACQSGEDGAQRQESANVQTGGPAGPVTLAVPSDPDVRGAVANSGAPADLPQERSAETLRARVDAAPADVRDAIERRAGCNHFGGEVGYDAERRAMIERALREARCDTIEADIAALRRRHSGDRAVLRLLDETADLSGF